MDLKKFRLLKTYLTDFQFLGGSVKKFAYKNALNAIFIGIQYDLFLLKMLFLDPS